MSWFERVWTGVVKTAEFGMSEHTGEHKNDLLLLIKLSTVLNKCNKYPYDKLKQSLMPITSLRFLFSIKNILLLQ